MKKLLLLFLLLIACPAFAADESAFDHVMRTNTIRCGYYVFPPVTYRDQKTNALSGFSVDVMNAIAKAGNLKLEWTEEVNFANWMEGLKAKRFDVVCTPTWPDVPLSRAVLFTIPMMYAGLSPMVRADDERFKDDDLDRLNQPDVTFLTLDGNALDSLTREVFDKAKFHTLPASMGGPTALQEIVTKKADAILLDRNAEIEYNKNNPVKLRLVAKDKPIKVQPFPLAIDHGDYELRDFLNNAIQDMHDSGTMDRILKRWETEPGLFLRVVPSYKAPR